MIRLALLASLCLVLAAPARAQALKTDDQKTLYALGLIMGRNIEGMSLSPKELEFVKEGFSDAALGHKPKLELDEWGPKVQKFAQTRSNASADKEKVAGRAYADKAAKEKGAEKLPDGVVVKILRKGDGPSPQPTDRVKVNYEGRLTNGTVFDSSYKRGQPAEFALNKVIKCWTEGVGQMHAGGKAQLTCPSDTAYGDHGHPPTIPGGATLVFDVELLAINGK